MKVKASARNGNVLVKMLMEHPMETGRRKDANGNLIPGHYITEVEAKHNGDLVFHAELGPAVSKDPYLAFEFTGGAAGDSMQVAWIDSLGKTAAEDVEIR